jgi:Flp pilus assembly protein TadD
VDTLLDLGSLLVEMNRFVEAGEKFRRVLEIEPDNADAHFELGDLAERQRFLDHAVVHFDVVLRLDDDYPGARRRLAALRLQRDNPEDAEALRELLAKELTEFHKAPESLSPADTEDLGRLLLDAGSAPEAVKVFRILAERRPDHAHSRHLLSAALFETGDRTGGMEEARRVLRIDPRFVASLHNLAMACIHEHQWKRARYWLREARRIDPDDAAIRRLRLALALHGLSEAWSSVYCFLFRRRPR